MLPGWFCASHLMTMPETVVLPTPPLPARAIVIVIKVPSQNPGFWRKPGF
jgi:hypothetical protein